MSIANPPSTLLSAEELIMPRFNALHKKYEIRSTTGQTFGLMVTTGSAVSRALLNTRRIALQEADGTPVGSIQDPPNIGTDTFTISAPDGRIVADVRKRLRAAGRSIDISVRNGPTIRVSGGRVSPETTLTIEDNLVAEATLNHPALTEEDVRRRTTVFRFTASIAPELKMILISGNIIIDMLRAKVGGFNASDFIVPN